MSLKGDTNKKWTSTKQYRDNYDEIFGKKESIQDVAKRLAIFDSKDPWLRDAWIDGFLVERQAKNPHSEKSPRHLVDAWDLGYKARDEYNSIDGETK